MTKKERELIGLYGKVFGSQEGQMVLEDIGKMAFAKITPFNANPYVMAKNTGRQELFFDICFLIEEAKRPVKRQELAEEFSEE